MLTLPWITIAAIMERIQPMKIKMISSSVRPTINYTSMQNATKVYKIIWNKLMAFFLIPFKNKSIKNPINFSRKQLKI